MALSLKFPRQVSDTEDKKVVIKNRATLKLGAEDKNF